MAFLTTVQRADHTMRVAVAGQWKKHQMLTSGCTEADCAWVSDQLSVVHRRCSCSKKRKNGLGQGNVLRRDSNTKSLRTDRSETLPRSSACVPFPLFALKARLTESGSQPGVPTTLPQPLPVLTPHRTSDQSSELGHGSVSAQGQTPFESPSFPAMARVSRDPTPGPGCISRPRRLRLLRAEAAPPSLPVWPGIPQDAPSWSLAALPWDDTMSVNL